MVLVEELGEEEPGATSQQPTRRPISWAEQLLGDRLGAAGAEEERPTQALLARKKLVLLYFSASWCPPCKAFTPKLVQWYRELANGGESLVEVVFISSDHSEAKFDEYFKKMPWAALPFKERTKGRLLADRFHVNGIPSLIVLDAQSGAVKSLDARSEVVSCHEGEARKLVAKWDAADVVSPDASRATPPVDSFRALVSLACAAYMYSQGKTGMSVGFLVLMGVRLGLFQNFLRAFR